MHSVSAGTRAGRTSTTVAAPTARSAIPAGARGSAGGPGGAGWPAAAERPGTWRGVAKTYLTCRLAVTSSVLAHDRRDPMPLPDFLIAGVPKAGTTALHAALAPHPGLYLSPVKEPKFF